MAVEHVKSTFVTNADSSPVVANTAGEGGPGALKCVEGSVTTVASSSQDSTYQICRIPSNCKVKKVFFECGAQAAGTIDVGLYYATDGTGGHSTSLLAAAAIDQDFFAADIAVTSAVVITDITNESTTYTLAKRTQPIWQAVGLTSDPGGYFDVVCTVDTALTTAATLMGLTVFYVD